MTEPTTTTTPAPDELQALRAKLRQAHEDNMMLAESLTATLAERDRALATVAAHAADVAAARGLRERHTALLRVAEAAARSVDEITPEWRAEVRAALIDAFASNEPTERTAWLWVKDTIRHLLATGEPVPEQTLVDLWEQELRRTREQVSRAEQRAAEAHREASERERAASYALTQITTNAERMRREVANLAALAAEAVPELADAAEFTPPPGRDLHPADVLDRLARWADVCHQLGAGLRGRPFHWRAVDAQHRLPIVAALGLTLVSRSHAERLGYRLRKGVSPVGVRYYTAPISREADVFILECQAVKVKEGEDG